MTDAPIAELLRTAEEARRSGRDADAVRLFEQVVERDPHQPAALNALGFRTLEAGDAARAADYFRRAAEVDPKAAALWINLATALRASGDDEGERSSLTRALEADQRHFMASLRLAELHERLGEHAQAAYRWGAVLMLARGMPDRPAALDEVLARGQAYVADRQSAFGEAIDDALGETRSRLDGRDRRRFDACIDTMLGRRSIYFNDCAGLHYPFLPADEFFDRSHFSWLPDLEAQTDAVRAEVAALLNDGAGFQPYVDLAPGTPQGKWSPLDKSEDWSAYHLWRHGEPIAEAQARCPVTTRVLEGLPRARMPRRAPTAFFSILRPRSHIPAHTGVSNVRAIVHLPLIVPPGCSFRVGGETRTWEEGKAFVFDDTIEHEAWNESDLPRAVLIFDVWNPHLSETEREMLTLFYEAADASGHNPDPGGSVD